MIYDQEKRLTFGDYVDKVFAVALIAIIAYGVSKMDAMTNEMSKINSKMATVLERTSNQKGDIEDLKDRVLNLEIIRRK